MSEREVLPRLWACHSHEMIGSRDAAEAHKWLHGCVCVELSQEASDGVREEWRNEQARRAAGFMAYARTRRAGV